MRVMLLAMSALAAAAIACGGDDQAGPGAVTTTAGPTTTSRATPRQSASPPATPTSAPTPDTPATPVPRPSIHPGPRSEPLGFPIDPSMRLGLVTGARGARTLTWGAGEGAKAYTDARQPGSDPDAANASGWNCRVHEEYEGQPAVDWYIPTGTPVFSTLDGTATLYATTVANGFDYYGLPREPYVGNPDRSRASTSPFPGPSGGLGVYVEVESGDFVTTSAHLELQATARLAVPGGSFYGDFGPDSDYGSLFAAIPQQGTTPIAQWQVQRGAVIGYSGDAGYSEAPHLHYAIQRTGSNLLLCPTGEAGFDDGGWLLK